MPKRSSRSRKLGSFLGSLNLFKDEKRRTFMSSRSSKRSLFSNYDRNSQLLRDYEKYYRGEGTVWAAINSIAFNTVMSGYSVKSDNPEAKKIIEKFCMDVDIENYMLKSTIFALVYGDAFMEIVYKKKGEPSRLKGIDPKTMFIDYDVYGDVNYYYQVINGQKGEPIDRKYICHLKLFPRPDSPYGISLLEPSRDTIKRKVRTDEAIASSIERHGFRKYVLYVGTDDDYPNEDELDAMETKFEDLSHDNEFILSGNCRLETVDDKGVQGVDEYFGYFQAQAVTGLMTSPEVLGLGQGSTEATANTRAVLYERMIKSFQHSIAKTIERQVFRKILAHHGLKDAIVKIEFNSVTDRDEALKARWLSDIMRSYMRTKYRPFTINEVREMMGKDAVDDPNADRIDIYEDEAKYSDDNIDIDEDEESEEEDLEDEETE